METPPFLDLSKSLSLDSVHDSSLASIPLEKDWYFDPITHVEVNESTEVTFMLLQHLSSDSKEAPTMALKPHIGPRPDARSKRPIVAKESRKDRTLKQLKRKIAARAIQRWFRRRRYANRDTHSEMKSTIACECGCRLM